MMTTDPHRHLDDETLNAVLDGEATEEERVDASACTECSARLVRLVQVATALGTRVPPSDAPRRRAAIDAALAAQDSDVAAPTPLDSRRRRRVSPGWAAAVAVVLAGALAVPLVDDLGGRGQPQEAATADDTTADTGDAGEATSSGGSAAEEEEAALSNGRLAPSGFGTPPHLGEVDLEGLDELAASIPAARPAPGAAQTAATEQPCEEPARRRDPSLQRLAYAAEGTVAGRPVVVLAFEVAPPGAPPAIRLVVLTTDGCAQLGSASVAGQ